MIETEPDAERSSVEKVLIMFELEREGAGFKIDVGDQCMCNSKFPAYGFE